MCHVIFKGTAITTEHAVNKIENLFISTTESGVQDHNSLLPTYKYLKKILKKKEILKPVVILSDGHSSRFDFDNLCFLHQNAMKLFIGPPDTTGVTQLLEQINHSFHDAYNAEKSNGYLEHNLINRAGFIDILGDVWNSWASRETIVKAAKRVGVSSTGLNVEWMQQDKFKTAELIQSNSSNSRETEIIICSPKNARKGSRDYYKFKNEETIKKN